MSDEQEDLRITDLMEALKTNKAVPELKRQILVNDLQYAKSINGDPSQQTNKRIIITGVSRELESYSRHEDLKNELAAIVNTALDNHAKNCVFVLMKARAEEEAKRRATAMSTLAGADDGKAEPEIDHDESSIKIGKLLEAKGSSALVLSTVVAVAVVVIGWVGWQQSKTREIIKQSMSAAVEAALKSE